MGSDLETSPSSWYKTEECCSQCGELLDFGETIIMVQVTRPEVHAEGLTLMPLLDDDGDFLYEHHFLHFGCWEEIADDYKKEVENTPPVLDGMGVIQCDTCQSSIREWETCGSVTHGELHRSRRSPSGAGHGSNLAPSGAPDVLCIHCLGKINDESLELWDEGVGQDGECDECQHVRCWRGFDCECVCHQEEEE